MSLLHEKHISASNLKRKQGVPAYITAYSLLHVEALLSDKGYVFHPRIRRICVVLSSQRGFRRE